MKLYVMPGSCALACHIALEWADAAYELEVLTRDAVRSEQFLAVNPKAKVPALVLDGNDVMRFFSSSQIFSQMRDLRPLLQT